jgi:hypothetical protein
MARWYGAGADHRIDGRSGPDLARSAPRGDRRRGERGGKAWLDKRPVGDRLSHQGSQKRKTNVIQRLRFLIASPRGVDRRASRRSPAGATTCSAWFRPAASKPGWFMSHRCRWSR